MKKFVSVASDQFLLTFYITGNSLLKFGLDSGVNRTLPDDLKNKLREKAHTKTGTRHGEESPMSISWIRDHVHTMKANKYWEDDLASYLAFFMGRQTGPAAKMDLVHVPGTLPLDAQHAPSGAGPL